MTIELCSPDRYPPISTHMPLARHDDGVKRLLRDAQISTHMPLARHDGAAERLAEKYGDFYSHASCEA